MTGYACPWNVVLPCRQPGAATPGNVAATRTRLPATVDVVAYVTVTAVGAAEVPDIGAYVAELGKVGTSELHLYHLGLAGPARWPVLSAAVAGAR